MKVLGLDVATKTGWAVYDLKRPVSAIRAGSFTCIGDTVFDMLWDMRTKLPPILREHAPDFVAIEAPLEHAPKFKKMVKTLYGEEEVEASMSVATIAMTNRLCGCAAGIVMGLNIPSVEVRAQTWQSKTIPKSIVGPPKKRVSLFCTAMKIAGGNADARDAALIALWCAGHCQELKTIQNARQQ
jgi:hypothetical protein